ncbi:DNA-directed RNA polymerase III subunit RPC4 [Dillenia turbinata]|uniref:DNA-directed RNA polymerase III subunit RPC4 n=1 Tax=Dillenia turbinata TaxID=194707 RepID=A0AAN8WDV3_9MAGN
MDSDSTNAPRKVRFAPKAPVRRPPKPTQPKIEKVEDADDAQAKDLLRRFNEASMNGRPKVERKSGPASVAFGYGATSNTIKSYGTYNRGVRIGGDVHASVPKTKDEYQEPWVSKSLIQHWDYLVLLQMFHWSNLQHVSLQNYYSYYPVTLPQRRPYSGNPDDLDEDEFGEVEESMRYDEDSVNPASELGLLVDNGEETMIFLQFPATMPLKKRLAAENGQVVANTKPGSVSRAGKPCGLKDLPAGHMGKMLVYRSGAIKLKLGDTLYDVSQGMNCGFAQDVVAINTEKKQCCSVGELSKRVIITPNLEFFSESMD